MISNVAVYEEYSPDFEQELRDFLPTLSTEAKFEDRIWYFDKLRLSEGQSIQNYKIHFNGINVAYSAHVRYWVLSRLKNHVQVNTVATNVTAIKRFFSFLIEEIGPIPLSEVNRITIEYYAEKLNTDTTIKISTKEGIWGAVKNFFWDMHKWPGMQQKIIVPPGNPFKRRELDRIHAERLIPDSVLEQLDWIFKLTEIPIETRCLYWILRLIPSRIQELTIMPIECLRPYGNDWVLQLYDKKQSGSQYYANNRMVHLKYKGMGQYLIDLIREQQKASLRLQDQIEEKKRGLLFACVDKMSYVLKAPDIERFKTIEPLNHTKLRRLNTHIPFSEKSITLLLWYEAYVRKLIKENRSFPSTNKKLVNEAFGHPINTNIIFQNQLIRACHDRKKPLTTILSNIKKYIADHIPKKDSVVWVPRTEKTTYILTGPNARLRFKRIAKIYNVVGEDGHLFNLITHAFRHNGITERLYEGFSYTQIRDMSGHEKDQMIGSYSHVKDDEIKKIAKKRREKGENGPAILFRGKIMNLDAKRAEFLLKRPRAYRIGKLGICSDITSCKSDLFECLDCDFLVPDADNVEYYENEAEKWNERSIMHQKNGNKMLAEQAEYMAMLHGKQLERIKLSLTMAEQEADNAD